MNERIKELAKQAADQTSAAFESSNFRQSEWEALFREKFAELIVRECIDKIETYHIPVGNSAAGELACIWTYDALKEIRDEIKEHFGVE